MSEKRAVPERGAETTLMKAPRVVNPQSVNCWRTIDACQQSMSLTIEEKLLQAKFAALQKKQVRQALEKASL